MVTSLEPFFRRLFDDEGSTLLQTTSALTEALSRPPPLRIMTVNTHHLWAYRNIPGFRLAVDRADAFTADGWPVVATGRALGRSVQRVTGRTLCSLLTVPEMVPTIRRIAVLGTTGGVTRLYERKLQLAGRTVCWSRHGAREDWDIGDVALQISNARADLVLVCVGSPHGEQLADEIRQRVVTRIVSVGAGIEIAVGVERVAPNIVGSCGLEWAWRLLHNPRRMWRRYAIECFPTLLHAPVAGFAVIRQNLTTQR